MRHKTIIWEFMSKKKENNGLLTASEFKVMDILWNMPDNSALGQEIQEKFAEPRPAYTTTLTFLKILDEKGFVASSKEGRCTRYKALLTREVYTDRAMKDVKNTFFRGSLSHLVSYFVNRDKLSESELNDIISLINQGKQS